MNKIAQDITKEYNLGNDEDWLELMESWDTYSSAQKSTLVALVWIAMQKKDKSFWLFVLSLAVGGLVLGLYDSPFAFAMGLVVMLVIAVLLFGLR